MLMLLKIQQNAELNLFFLVIAGKCLIFAYIIILPALTK